MYSMAIWILIAADVLILAGSTYIYVSVKAERRRREEETRRVDRITSVLGEMAHLSESAFKNMSHTIKTIETEVQKADREPMQSPTDKRVHVLNLLKKGLDVDEITRRLNMPRGEVELVVDLHQWFPKASGMPARQN